MHNLVHNRRNLYFQIKQFITSQLQGLFDNYYKLIRKSFHQLFRDCFYLRPYPAAEQGLCVRVFSAINLRKAARKLDFLRQI